MNFKLNSNEDHQKYSQEEKRIVDLLNGAFNTVKAININSSPSQDQKIVMLSFEYNEPTDPNIFNSSRLLFLSKNWCDKNKSRASEGSCTACPSILI